MRLIVTPNQLEKWSAPSLLQPCSANPPIITFQVITLHPINHKSQVWLTKPAASQKTVMHQKRCHTSNTCEQVHPSHTNVTEVLLSALLSALQGPKMCTCIQKNCIRNSIWFRANRLHLKKHFNWFVPTAMFSDSTNPHGPCNSCDPPQLLLHLCINTRTTPALRDAADLNTPPQLIAHKQAS
jgi:hypothetical protein